MHFEPPTFSKFQIPNYSLRSLRYCDEVSCAYRRMGVDAIRAADGMFLLVICFCSASGGAAQSLSFLPL